MERVCVSILEYHRYYSQGKRHSYYTEEEYFVEVEWQFVEVVKGGCCSECSAPTNSREVVGTISAIYEDEEGYVRVTDPALCHKVALATHKEYDLFLCPDCIDREIDAVAEGGADVDS